MDERDDTVSRYATVLSHHWTHTGKTKFHSTQMHYIFKYPSSKIASNTFQSQ